MFGWEAAWTALVLFFVPVKGAWFGFIPHVWSVFVNVFMLLMPFRSKLLKKQRGRGFAIAFTVAAIVPVGLLFITGSANGVGIHTFEVGFMLWALSIIGASAWFSWEAWKKRIALLPNMLLATALFSGLFVWSPLLAERRRRAEQERDAWLRSALAETENTAAFYAITQHGLLAFDEPMSSAQEQNLESYILSRQEFAPQELIAGSQHYHNSRIMRALAMKPNCPAEALEILYRHATDEEKIASTEMAVLQDIYPAIAKNANTPLGLVLQMLRSESPSERTAAVQSGKLPIKEKSAYLKRGCTLTDDHELLAIAKDSDTPVEILECLAAKPGAAVAVASNPRTPTRVLEQMSQSSDWRIANPANIELGLRKFPLKVFPPKKTQKSP